MTRRRSTLDKAWLTFLESALLLVDERNARTANSQVSHAQWLADRTIRLNLGHKTGQTSFVCGYADEFDLILVDTVQQASGLRRMQNPKADVLALYELLDNGLNLPQYNRVWCDNLSELSASTLNRLYTKTRHPAIRWIILGGNNV